MIQRQLRVHGGINEAHAGQEKQVTPTADLRRTEVDAMQARALEFCLVGHHHGNDGFEFLRERSENRDGLGITLVTHDRSADSV